MVHIHYTQGPVILQDISKETSDAIINQLTEGDDVSTIAAALSVSEGVVNIVKDIKQSGMKRCAFCGAIFDPAGRKGRVNTCKAEHYLPCIDCGALLLVKESYVNYMKAGGRRCPTCRGKQISATRRNKSEEEKKDIVNRQQATMMERYGGKTPLQVPEMKAKIQQTVRERYGVENLSQSAEIQRRIKENSQKRFGVDHYSNAPEIRQHMIDGMIAKYGVPIAQQSLEIQQKTKQTNMQRYGVENVFQSEEIRKRFVGNHLAKYGVAWPHQRPDLIEQVKQSNKIKYGAEMYPVSDDYMRKVVVDPSKFESYKSFMEDPEKFISEHYVTKPSVKQLSEDLGITDSPIYDKLISIGRRDLATEFAYSMETQLIEFVRTIDAGAVIETHNRTLLSNKKEIDVYLPEYKIGFECNPTYTHNSSFSDPWGAAPKAPSYHRHKTDEADKAGVFLFHIFGYEWTNRRPVILSMIRNLLGKTENVVYARKTEVRAVSAKEAMAFLDANHRQGATSVKYYYGLYTEDNQLVSVMSFNKMRPTIGKTDDDAEDTYELSRFCNLLDTSVVGGASKLLKHFIREHSPKKIVSFSDRAHTRGSLYSTLGFHEVSRSDASYVWVNLKDDSYHNRVACQKSNLRNLFKDDSIDIENKTEREIMMEHGYAQVYDSGTIRWELDLENRYTK